MHTVAELHTFVKAAAEAGMTADEVMTLVDYLSENPTAGAEIPGTGGCRKVRVAGRGKGKSGGYRTITFYTGRDLPVFLITVFGKGEKSNLTQGERNQLRDFTKAIVNEYKKRVSPLAEKKGA